MDIIRPIIGINYIFFAGGGEVINVDHIDGMLINDGYFIEFLPYSLKELLSYDLL